MPLAYPPTAREAVALLHALAADLALPDRRDAALVSLRHLADLARDRPDDAPLRLATVEVGVGGRQARLELLLLPSIFAPEDWAFTFLEGLLDVPLDEYAGKRLVEVGTGSGWIAIALARFTGLQHVLGVDLNPHARVVATCNAWLNGDAELVARLAFGESDLLRQVPATPAWDFVAGCIPQVLASDLAAGLDEADERRLHDLSNYCAAQHVYEDRFGLGLIARLLDECPELLAPDGRLLLNLAGRPGRAIIARMFSVRGFEARPRVTRRVRQAADTDIAPLAELEARSGREFEFFVEAHSSEPIRAATAVGWLAAGHPIWHELAVWQAKLGNRREILALRAALRSLEMARLLPELDLGAASPEQLAFVLELARQMQASPRLPYTHEAGDRSFRERVAHYLHRYFGLRLDPAALFVGPGRAQTVHGLLLATCDPGDRVLVSRNVHDRYGLALQRAGVQVTVTNDTLAEIRQLLDAFDVRVVLLAVEAGERSNLQALREIVATAARRGILVVLDESALFHITREVEPRTMFEFLARESAPPNLVVLYGLIKNAVYPDWELTLLLPVPPRLHADLEIAAEVTWSRVATLAQRYYDKLFADLLAFRVAFGAPPEPPPPPVEAARLPRSHRVAELAALPAFQGPRYDPADPELVRLDYGENESELPPVLVEGLLHACATPADADAERALAEAVAAFVLETRGVRYGPREVAFGEGVWPLIHDLGAALHTRLGRPPRVFATMPAYGLVVPTLRAAGCEVETGTLQALLDRPPGLAQLDAVLVAQPGNPTGAFLSHAELVALASWVVEARVLLVSDEVFGLVDLLGPVVETVPSPVSLEQAVPGIGARTVLLGGLSKEFAAGGLRLGWLACRDRDLLRRLDALVLGRPHRTAVRAAGWLYAAWLRGPSGRLLHPQRHGALRAWLAAMRRDLADKRQLLVAAFGDDGGVEPGLVPGGLFVAPRVTAWLGQRAGDTVLTEANLAQVLHDRTHVLVNGGAWCGDPTRVRAVFALPRDRVVAAAQRVRAFRDGLQPAAGT